MDAQPSFIEASLKRIKSYEDAIHNMPSTGMTPAQRQGLILQLRDKISLEQTRIKDYQAQQANNSQLKSTIDQAKLNSREQVATVTNIPEILKNNPLLLAIGAVLIVLVVLK